jgi:hypothetical protein
MPLPLILVGVAIAAGGYGVKKGLDAKEDFDAAESINLRAKRIYDKAKEELKDTRDNTQKSMEQLGATKLEIWTDSIVPFVDTFQKIKNINVDDSNIDDMEKLPSISQSDLAEMRQTAIAMTELASGGTTALGSGGLAGLAAYGSVQMLASASTGTAISALSGAAASNATLAWLGGGSLATGGMGIAGGTAVLGGIVAGPVLAVGGMMMASKAEEAKEGAYSNLAKAELAVEEMESAVVATNGIRRRFKEIDSVLTKLNNQFEYDLNSFVELVNDNYDYSSYSDSEKEEVFKVASYAKTLKNILDTQVIDTDGSLTSKSRRAVKQGNRLLRLS